MGYTHYFRNSTDFTNDQWQKFSEKAKEIFDNSDIPLAGNNGEEKTLPEITLYHVSFNGLLDDSHETCCVTKRARDFSFCKTAEKPYDKIVVAIYKAAREANPNVQLSSDGGEEVFG